MYFCCTGDELKSSTHGNRINSRRILVGKDERKTPSGRTRRRLHNILQITFRSVGLGDVGLIHMTNDQTQCQPFADTIMKFTLL